MLSDLKAHLQSHVETAIKDFFLPPTEAPTVELEFPNDKSHGDFSTNVAMKSAKILRKPPIRIAEEFCAAIERQLQKSPLKEKIGKVEVKNPGFINFSLSLSGTYDILLEVFEKKENYGQSDFGKKEKVQIEFVSANPTGPLSIAHARQAAVGDALGNILDFTGHLASKEYYVNDEGNQINILGRSLQYRACENLGEKIEFPEECYQGDYIRDIAQKFIDEKHVGSLSALKEKKEEEFRKYALDYLMAVIKKELDDFGVHFDIWSHQSKIATSERIAKLLESLKKDGFVYEQEGAWWFKTTQFGDDKDRVVKKSDGAYTYFTPDIVYHKDKFSRGFDRVVNIWGPDHHGYIPRLTAAIQALGQRKEALQVVIVQLATIYRDGKPVSMSTRRGQYVSLREVMDEVGVDAARFFFLMRRTNAHLDFDLELAKKETPENPVYYIQYAHARICGVLEKAKETNLVPAKAGFQLLKEPEETTLIKMVGSFPDTLVFCSKEMDPFGLVVYLMELATCFHRFYDKHRVVDPENTKLSGERLALIDAARIALANGLHLLGVNAPKRM